MKAIFITPSFEFMMNVPDKLPPQMEIMMPAGIELLMLPDRAEPVQRQTEVVILQFDLDKDRIYRYTGYTR